MKENSKQSAFLSVREKPHVTEPWFGWRPVGPAACGSPVLYDLDQGLMPLGNGENNGTYF